jgi:hypothetical protein
MKLTMTKMEKKMKCITFDKAAQDALPENIKAKMKADRERARIEQGSMRSCAVCGEKLREYSDDVKCCEWCGTIVCEKHYIKENDMCTICANYGKEK